MKRLQNFLLIVWVVSILLFAAFNWNILWSDESFTFLFMDFEGPWLFWFLLAALGMPLLTRLLASAGARRTEREASDAVAEIKIKAFDRRDDDLAALAQQVQDKLEATIRETMSRAAAEGDTPVGGGEPESDPAQEPEPEKKKSRKKKG